MNGKIYVIFLFFALSLLSIQAQTKYLWLHGLNGDSNSWFLYKNHFTANTGELLTYSSKKSINDISKNLYNQNKLSFGENSVIIAHSMGGLVAREIERLYPSSVKGIITVGTPHQGAHVATEIHNGGINVLSEFVVNRALSSLRSSKTAVNYTVPQLRILELQPCENALHNLITTTVNGKVNSAIKSGIEKNYNEQCTFDMQPESDFIKRLSNHQIQVPILAISTEEDKWALARLGYCANNISKLDLDANINKDGDFDKRGYNMLRNTNYAFISVQVLHSIAGVFCDIGGIFSKQLRSAATAHYAAANEWESTVKYIDDGLDFDHAVLLGSYRVDKIVTETKFAFLKSTSTSYVTVPEPHDGVVSVKAQELTRGNGPYVIFADEVLKGVNHLEQRNHPKVKAEIDKALRKTNYGTKFNK